jgi:hypothetical protein
MAAGTDPLIRLWHGTTRQRAEEIIQNGPDPAFREPGGSTLAEGFSTARDHQPWFPQGEPEDVARGKDRLFPGERGPVILEIEVPQSVVFLADLVVEVRFERGFGLEELLALWPSLSKRIIPL